MQKVTLNMHHSTCRLSLCGKIRLEYIDREFEIHIEMLSLYLAVFLMLLA